MTGATVSPAVSNQISADSATDLTTESNVQTDLLTYVHSDGRAEKVRQVRAKIDELGIQYIYYQFISVTGRITGKGVPADHWESVADGGIQLVYGAMANLAISRQQQYLGYGPESSELVAIPDVDTFCQLPWDPRVARVYCVCFRNREEPEDPGAVLTADCRGNLLRLHNQFQQKHGLQLRHGCEPEMMWLKKGPDGKPAGGATQPNCYHIDQFEELRPVFLKVIEYSRAMGLDMIQGDHEDAPGQLELNFMYDDALRTCDRLTTYRQICAQVAREFNLIACFMSKPFMGVSASGCHHNLSLWRGGEKQINSFAMDALPGMPENYTYSKGGENTFLPDKTLSARKPGPVGLNCIGGVIAHLQALTAIGCSTVNSYRRLWDAGFWAPVYSDWGYQNRTCGLRISAPGRFEYRAVDSMVNPYLMAAAILQAFDDGLSRDLDPGEPEQRNIYQAMESGKQVKKLPMCLGEALDRLAEDEVIKAALPKEMYRVFSEYKRDEWERFLATTSNWDSDNYMNCLP